MTETLQSAATQPNQAPPPAGRVVLIYAVFAGSWILLSDHLLELWLEVPATFTLAGTLKGLAFVVVTSSLLFLLLLRRAGQRPEMDAAAGSVGDTRHGGRTLYLSIALLAAVFALLAAGGVKQSLESHHQLAGGQLKAFARLKATYLEGWIEERRRDAELARVLLSSSELLPRWRDGGDMVARRLLLTALENVRASAYYSEVLLCDEHGEILLRTGTAGHGANDAPRDAVRRAVASGETRMADLFRMEHPQSAPTHLDFIVPVQSAPGRDGATAVIVLRADLDRTVYPQLQTWPLPNLGAETLLVRREGDHVLYLNELRHRQGTALRLRLPLSDGGDLAARALQPGYRAGQLMEGVDYRGVAALGAAQPVFGTSWWVIAKLDRAEVDRVVRRDALWVVFASLLAWGVAAALALLLFQRRELQHTERRRHAQAERLRALRMLDALANSSDDLIFAQDREGRFTLFNRAAQRFTGKSADQALGRDETALFPPPVAERLIADSRRVMEEGRILTFEDRIPTPDGERVYLTTKGPLRDADGSVIGLFGIARDISERAGAEELMRRNNEELERFNRAMVGRELDMLRLKREVNALAAALGRAAPYDLAVFDAAADQAPPGASS